MHDTEIMIISRKKQYHGLDGRISVILISNIVLLSVEYKTRLPWNNGHPNLISFFRFFLVITLFISC